MIAVLAIVLGGVVTYVERVLFLIGGRLRPPKAAERFLPLVGPAVLGAITLPGIVAPRDEISLAETLPALAAAVVSWALYRLTKQAIIGLLGGLIVWWTILAVLAALGLRD